MDLSNRSDRPARARVRPVLAMLALVGASFAPAVARADGLALPEPVGMGADPNARLVLAGNRAFVRGDLATAERDYRSALAANATFAVASFNLGLVEMHEGANARGKRDMDRGIALATRHGMSARDVAKLRALRAAFASAPVADA